jgi:hypothetical protein
VLLTQLLSFLHQRFTVPGVPPAFPEGSSRDNGSEGRVEAISTDLVGAEAARATVAIALMPSPRRPLGKDANRERITTRPNDVVESPRHATDRHDGVQGGVDAKDGAWGVRATLRLACASLEALKGVLPRLGQGELVDCPSVASY